MRYRLSTRSRLRKWSVGAGVTPSLLAALVLSAGCGTPDTPPPKSITAQLGTEFTLAVGSTAHLDNNRLAVLVDKISDDSRCPRDTECYWPGDALVSLRVTAGNTPSQQVLHTYRDPRNVAVDGYRIQLRGLTPGGRHGEIPQEQYRVSLLATPESDHVGPN